jgi:hypothetical protein
VRAAHVRPHRPRDPLLRLRPQEALPARRAPRRPPRPPGPPPARAHPVPGRQRLRPYRHTLLDASQTALAQAAAAEHAARVTALRRAIADTDAKSSRLIRTLETTDDLDTDFITGIKQRRAELRAQREDLERQIAKAQEQAQDTHNPALLDHLPVTAVDLEDLADEESRRLLEALRLEIRYDPATRMADCSITLSGDTIDAVSRSTREVMAQTKPGNEAPSRRQPGGPSHDFEDLRSAPRGIRTFAPGSGG